MDCGEEEEEEDVVKSFQSTTSLPGKKREATLLPRLHLIQMEYFRRLLGALQETLDYVSSFTTYLLGDETYPGAEQSGPTRELARRSSCHDSEVETATYSGDVSPQGQLDTFERPLTTEVTPFNQEIHKASETVVTRAGATEAIPEPSKSTCKRKRQDVVAQKLSESPQFLIDAPKPRATSTVIGNDCQRDLEGLALVQGLHRWEPEGTSLIEGVQQEIGRDGRNSEVVDLDIGHSPDLEPERTLAGRNRDGEQKWRGETDGVLQSELEGTQKTEQRTSWPVSVVEQPTGLKWTGETEHEALKELAKVAENQHLGEQEESETKWGTNEGVQQIVLERAETEGNQEGVLEEVGRIHQQEPGRTMITFEEQELRPKWVAEEGNSHQSGLEVGKDIEDQQQGMLEISFKNEGQVEDKQREKQMDGVWDGTSERPVEEDLEEVVLEKIETRVVQSWEPEGTERSLQGEPSGSRISFDTYLFSGEKMIGEAEKPTEELEEKQEDVVDMVTLEDENASGHKPWEIEVTERRLHKETMGSRTSLDTCLFGGEQIVGESEKLTEEQEAAVVLEEAETGEHQPRESEKTERSLQLEPTRNRVPHNAGISGGEQVEGEPEKMIKEQEEIVTVVVLEEGETGGHQPWESEEPERRMDEEPMGIRSTHDICLFGGEQIIGEPEGLTEEQEAVERVILEEAETRVQQSHEPERTENSLELEPTRNRAHLNACISGGEKVGEQEMTEVLVEEVTVVMLEKAETEGHQPWESDVPERRLYEEPVESRAPLDTYFFSGEQMVGEPEALTEEQEEVERVVLEEAETGGGQPSEPEGPEKSLPDEPSGNRDSPDACLFAGPSTFPDEVLPLDTSAQKERVILRRKSSIRRAPSLKKPRLPTESQPLPAVPNEAVSSPSQAPRQPNPRRTGFGPMHPNMMAELQLRLRRPQ